MAYRWNDNELDTALYEALLLTESPSEKEIHELVAKGANVNAVDSTGDSLLMKAILSVFPEYMAESRWEKPLDLRFIRLLIDLGADVNYAPAGQFNCLFQACLTWRPKLVKMLLKAGANPNCYSSEECSSLLAWVENDAEYETEEGVGGGGPLQKCVELLKQYGATKKENE